MRQSTIAVAAVLLAAAAASAQNAYRRTVLVSNRVEDAPQILDPLLRNGWGIAIRPPGAGGHWWINNAATGTTTTYVGDAPGVPLYQDELLYVDIPSSHVHAGYPDTVSQPTGIVYTGRAQGELLFTGEGVTGPATFLFCSLDGTISAWRNGQTRAVNVVDTSVEGSMYSGIAATERATGNRIYACDFNLERLRVFDAQFREIATAGDWRDPAVPPLYAIYNIQYLEGRLYAAWAHVGDDPGEEDQYPGYGYVSAFDTEGRLLQSFEHRIELNAPWGLAIAPADFGSLSRALLVGNFGDGRVLAFDRETGRFIDHMRDEAGVPVEAEGLWGLQFGNGVRLGRLNHLYFAAGPNAEEDGLFGKWEPVVPGCSIADVAGTADGRADGRITREDYDAFLARFDAGDLRADVAAIGGFTPSDGLVTVDDYTAFVNAFAEGCR